ncbi:hypothetical protein [Deinococcus cellulosilyticus]|uniref:Uncharacterized protein n=1 Tax=Deinococcus cellulosilyticus (strain DSM 18568 / NBRC 106333 / KACC 11606 / 5516J-15) TaxID=1223518 RepID=A0A511NA11_DEIC1|nr:hypothetical protein [Deinococcus cellulosilyticus]GEM49338.1 hypothetical protein DC3_49730 [Deinococcus cellulosilyticus NBRC 106333 = KACC 11606]
MDWIILSLIMLIVLVGIYLLHRITNPPEIHERPMVQHLSQEHLRTDQHKPHNPHN